MKTKKISGPPASILLTALLPRQLFFSMDDLVRTIDSDRSKFVRAAIREKMERHGIQFVIGGGAK
jgi:hypothetical protein